MVTIKQHYYPRCLLKNFSNDRNKIYAYIPQNNIITLQNYENVCHSNKTYESDNVIDNILENELSSYETKMCSLTNNILSNVFKTNIDSISINKFLKEKSNGLKLFNYDFLLSQEDKEFIFKYLLLQYLRTDYGRLNHMLILEQGSSYAPRTQPFNKDDIIENKDKLEEFNRLYKKGKNLKNLIDKFNIPEKVDLKIALSPINLLTSDNPVIFEGGFFQISMPISPYVTIEFIEKSILGTNNLFAILSNNKALYLNKCTITTSNYYVLSNIPFKKYQQVHLKNKYNHNDLPKSYF
ncbi:DUF4238 domain-containing protein [Staphylococcus chromogenes]|uniref:DUF4238 domain-containing protein n=1 Tax=Staphylococcus chromogenes TaxID=46126 RepID=UPI0014050CB9|nr:DUF4238 domain-containing protein [Staphylococcus chromogenes]QIN26326.1 DUF4238 domain-containing protein [Staphylococcus chromogenes]